MNYRASSPVVQKLHQGGEITSPGGGEKSSPIITSNKITKGDTNIPTEDEFLEYALQKGPLLAQQNVRLKYQAWVANGWKDGNDRPIKAWKSKLLNTIPYLPTRQRLKVENQPLDKTENLTKI